MCTQLLRLAKLMPEYETVLAMYGVVGSSPHSLWFEISDARSYPCHMAFASVNPAVNQSSKHGAPSDPKIKRSSPTSAENVVPIVCPI